MTTQIAATSQGSPFDSIRRFTDSGREYWSARELMPLLGYDSWRRFEETIERAMIAVKNTGVNEFDHFADTGKKVPLGSGAERTVTDYEMTRFGAYMAAMNGDPRKPEIAAAQSYFAIQTRMAETAPKPLTLAERTAQVMGELDAMVQSQKLQLEAQAPLVAQATTFREADGLRTIGDLTNDLKVHAASNYPGVKVHQQDVFDLAGELGLIIRGNTVRRNQPTARAIEAGWVKPKDVSYDTENHGRKSKVYTRLTPRGYGRVWDAAVIRLRGGYPIYARESAAA